MECFIFLVLFHYVSGAVSLIGAEPGLWSVIGGNAQIPRTVLEKSKASLIRGRVVSIELIKGDHTTYELDYVKLDSENMGQTSSKEYDIVIMATPIYGTKNKIAFIDFPSTVTDFSQDFHQLVAMFVKGEVNKTTFQLNPGDKPLPALFSVSQDLFFNSIEKQIPTESPSFGDNIEKSASSESNVWKTFLNDVPTEEGIDFLFQSRSTTKIVNWLAYPEYKPKMDLPPFVLYEHLYYINAIESAASALEMSAIGAKNVALLAFNHWYGHYDRIDETSFPPETDTKTSKNEL